MAFRFSISSLRTNFIWPTRSLYSLGFQWGRRLSVSTCHLYFLHAIFPNPLSFTPCYSGGSKGRVQEMCTPYPWDEAFFLVFAFKICLPHQSVTPFLSGAPPPKKNPGSTPAGSYESCLNIRLTSAQGRKKRRSDSPGQVHFALGQVKIEVQWPGGQVKFASVVLWVWAKMSAW